MGNWIKQVSTPKRLFLAWQAPDHLDDRFRWAVGNLSVNAKDLDLAYLANLEFERMNQGKSFLQLEHLGYQGYPGYRLGQLHKNFLSTLMRRLPPRNRSDFVEYKRQFRIPQYLTLSEVELLAITEAKLPSDGFSVVDPLDPEAESCDLLLEVAGFRYYASELLNIKLGDPLALVPEPDNEYDPDAIMIRIGERRIGYVNRLQAATMGRWLKNRRVSAYVERLNGKGNKPRAFLFIRVRPS